MYSNIVRTTIHLSQLTAGMTVEKNNELITVGKKDIRFCGFMGYSFQGCSFPRTITRVQFAVPTAFGIVLR